MLLRDYLKLDINHLDLELDEVQSLDLEKIVGHKLNQAYEKVDGPVLVEDNGLYIKAFGGLPGPFIKWFLKAVDDEGICKLLNVYDDRDASPKVCYGYRDAKRSKIFTGEIIGKISDKPRGKGHGWNTIFIPKGQSKTYAEMDDEWMGQYGLRAATVFPQLKKFLSELDIE